MKTKEIIYLKLNNNHQVWIRKNLPPEKVAKIYKILFPFPSTGYKWFGIFSKEGSTSVQLNKIGGS